MKTKQSKKIIVSGHILGKSSGRVLEIKTVRGAQIRIDKKSIIKTLPLEPSAGKNEAKSFVLSPKADTWLKITAEDVSNIQINRTANNKPLDSIKKYVDDGSTESKSRDDDDESVL